MTDESIYVFTMNMLPNPGLSDDPYTAQGQLSPIVVAFDFMPNRDDLKRAFLDINGFNTELFSAHLTIGLSGFDRDMFIAESEKYRKAGTPGFFSSGTRIGPWLFRCTRIPLRKHVSLDGVVTP